MIGSVGEEIILRNEVGREAVDPGNFPRVPAGQVGALRSIREDRADVFFEGFGTYSVKHSDILSKSFTTGMDVVLPEDVQGLTRFYKKGSQGKVIDVRVGQGGYLYVVAMTTYDSITVPSHLLRNSQEGLSMNIAELAKHMIAVGSGCNPNTVPDWFQPVVNALKDLPQLSQMGQAQMEFVIKNHMTYRSIDNRQDLVTNVLFIIRACTAHRQLKTMEEKLYGYKEKLEIEWKKLNKPIGIEYQYAALMAYAETLND